MYRYEAQSPLEEWANEGVGLDSLCVRSGLKKYRMPQTSQYPRDIPNMKATIMVESSRNDSRNGVISLSFYKPATEVDERSYRSNGGFGRLTWQRNGASANTLRCVDAGVCSQIRYGSRAMSSPLWSF